MRGGRSVGRRDRSLREPVGVAARVLAPHAVALGHQRLRHHVVEKRAIVADQQQRARVRLQRVLEQLERFDVEVVRRLVEHEQVRRLREQPRKQQAIALAAGQRGNRRLRALRRKQEVAEVGQHVSSLPAGLDPFRSRADRLDQRAAFVELLAQAGRSTRRRGSCRAGRVPRRVRARRGSASAASTCRRRCGPINPSRSPRITCVVRSRTIGRPSKRLRDVRKLRDQLPGALARIQRQPDVAQPVAARRALAAQHFEPPHAPFVARAPRFDALADPRLFLRPELVELAARCILGDELVGASQLIGRNSCPDTSAAVRDPARRSASRRRSRNARSCVMTIAAGSFRTSSSSCAIASMSRWFVGSSSSIRSGDMAKASASAARFRSPPEQVCRRTRLVEAEAMQELDQPRLGAPALALVSDRCDVPASRKALAQRRRGRQRGFLLDQCDAGVRHDA